MTKSAAPKGLRDAGKAMWARFTGKYDFRPDELVVLEKACRASDRIATMEDELGDAVTSTGSMGQVVVHPLIPEIRAHEALVARLLASLKIPDDPAGAGSESRSTQARAAAQSRWAAAHGATA